MGKAVATSIAKRVFDLVVACLFFLLFGWLFLLLFLLVLIFLGWPVFFVQTRPGLGAKPFQLIKFRTMTNGKKGDGSLLSDEARLTKFGAFLRKSSLDELPELWNVLKGEMSLVGPRPLLMQYLELYTERQAMRQEARPGITGWAQVNGRNQLNWTDRFECDVWYIESWNFWLDIKILFKTVLVTLSRSGISADGHATMPEFTGSGQLPK